MDYTKSFLLVEDTSDVVRYIYIPSILYIMGDEKHDVYGIVLAKDVIIRISKTMYDYVLRILLDVS